MRRLSLAVLIALLSTVAVRSIALADASDTPWTLHTITSGPAGADGVDLADIDGDGLNDVVTSAWEQAGLVTVSLRPERATDKWPTVEIVRRLHGVEDAIFADVDGDGTLDVVSACECRKIVIHFAPKGAASEPTRLLDPTAWSSVTLTASLGTQRWLKVAVADINGDGRADIIGGGKVSPSTIGWFRAPANPRNGSAWAYRQMSEVGWTQSLEPFDADEDGDMDVVVSDKLPVRYQDGRPLNYGLRGSRWLENAGAGAGASWINHRIGFSLGEHKFLQITDFDSDGDPDILDGTSAASYNRTFFRRNLGGWASWREIPIPQPANVGHYQDVKAARIDLDADLDLVFSYSHADGALSGVAWLAAKPDGTWQRGEISGPAGTKYDNVVLEDVDRDGDLDAVTSEQIEQLGVIWYENPTR
jgi:hypothetical protein